MSSGVIQSVLSRSGMLSRAIFVSTPPGQIAWMAMLSAFSSSARAFVRPFTPCFAAVYADWRCRPLIPVTLEMLMMRPARRARMCGRKAWIAVKTDVRFTSSVLRHSSGVSSRKGRNTAHPALFTRMSTAGNAASAAAAIRRTSSGSATSHRHHSARRPSARIPAAVSSSSGAVRAARNTSQPSRAKASAMARPMPRPAPVMTAVLPSSSMMSPSSKTRRAAPRGRAQTL